MPNLPANTQERGTVILERIVEHKRIEVRGRKRSVPERELADRLGQAPPVRDFAAALRRSAGPIRVIAELKRASPSAGLIRKDYDPVAIAGEYERCGASAVSVLTDGKFFQGSLEELRRVRAAVELPVLRKDFIIDRYQVLEARCYGADAVLLIAEVLDQPQLVDLLEYTRHLGMEALVELHEPSNLQRVLSCGAAIVGINNRDLKSFRTDVSHTLQLLPEIGPDRITVSESGIATRADVQRLERAGLHAILVGEALMRADQPGRKLAELLRAGSGANGP